MTPAVTLEYRDPRGIAYDYNGVHVWLKGANAYLYRGMVWMYGKEQATREYWEMFHKKAMIAPQQITASNPVKGL